MCFSGPARGLRQAHRGDLRWTKEAQAPASPATFFCISQLHVRRRPAGRREWHLASCPESGATCGMLAGLRGGCGAAVGRLWGCGTAVGAAGRLRGYGEAAGRLRGGCGAAARWTQNGGIRARRFRAGWGDTPATAGVRENTKNCGIRARRFRVKWGDTPADLGVHENHKITAKLIGS